MLDYPFIANLMCQITIDELWTPRIEWAKKKDATTSLKVRVGTGKATYVRHASRLKGPMTLTYGVKMIESKSDPKNLGRWLTSREIEEHGFFDGEVTMLNAIAHTIIHEFGHVVQVLMGQRYAEDVHNPEFYNILKLAHNNGHAERIRNIIHNECLANGMDLSAIKKLPDVLPGGLTIDGIRVGQAVSSLEEEYLHLNPFRVLEKRKKIVVIQSLTHPEKMLGAIPGWLTAHQGEVPALEDAVLTMEEIQLYDLVITASTRYNHLNPFEVVEKRQKFVIVRSTKDKKASLKCRPHGLKRFIENAPEDKSDKHTNGKSENTIDYKKVDHVSRMSSQMDLLGLDLEQPDKEESSAKFPDEILMAHSDEELKTIRSGLILSDIDIGDEIFIRDGKYAYLSPFAVTAKESNLLVLNSIKDPRVILKSDPSFVYEEA